MIEQHLQILKNKGMVAFGKVKSKLRDYEHPNEEALETIYDDLDVEMWYVFDDLRLIVKDDFQKIRDNILANLILWLW